MESAEGNPIIFQWLDRIGLAYSIPTFRAMGITSPQALMRLTYEDYDSVGVTELEDRKRLFQLVHRVREAASKQPATESETSETTKSEKSAAAPTMAPDIEQLLRDKISAALFDRSVTAGAVQEFMMHLLGRDLHIIKRATEEPAEMCRLYEQWLEDNEETKSEVSGGSAEDDDQSIEEQEVAARNVESRKPSSSPHHLEIPQARPKTSFAGSRKPATTPMETSRPQTAAQPPAPAVRELDRRGQRDRDGWKYMDKAAIPVRSSAADLAAKIKVVVRKRPSSRAEAKRNDTDVVQALSRRTMIVHEPKQKVDLTRYTETHEFTFDDVFDDSCDTALIYRHTAQPLVETIFDGGNATCFAYGQTGSGKTFTMMGMRKPNGQLQPGIYLLAARDIFQYLEQYHREKGKGSNKLTVKVSFYEIYGGKLFDLLNERRALRALVDQQQAVNIVGLSASPVSGVEKLMEVIEYGLSVRSTGSTGANSDSSRSHAVLQIALHDRRDKQRGKFSFIDLAGSERGADTTHNDRKTRMEGAEINRSLLALKECIRSLYQEHDHTPFRGSKLTQVLKDSFVGNSRTVMIATVAPNVSNVEHSLNTLRYGYRVKEIRKEDDADLHNDPPHGHGAEYVTSAGNAGAGSTDEENYDPEEDLRMERPATAHTRGRSKAEQAQARRSTGSRGASVGAGGRQKASRSSMQGSPVLTSQPSPHDHRRGGGAVSPLTTSSHAQDSKQVELNSLVSSHKRLIQAMMQQLREDMKLVRAAETGEFGTAEEYADRIRELLSEKHGTMDDLYEIIEAATTNA